MRDERTIRQELENLQRIRDSPMHYATHLRIIKGHREGSGRCELDPQIAALRWVLELP